MAPYFPIKDITTYINNWTILGKVVDKSKLRSLKGDNALFHVDIVDKNGDTIRAKFWGVAATKWNEVLQKGSVYTFSKGTVNLSNKKFNTLPHKYEITFNSDSLIELSDEINDINIERNYDFVSLRDIKSTSRDPPFVVDLLCFAKSMTPVSVTNTKYNKEIKRRSLFVVDDTSYELEVTVWGDMAESSVFDNILDKPVIISQVTIKEWNGGRIGQTGYSSDIKLASSNSVRNKDRLTTLESWYHQALLQNETFKSMRAQAGPSGRESYEFSTIDNVVEKGKGYFTFNCKLRKLFWRNKDGTTRLWYRACPNCHKKAIMEQDSNVYRCITCDDSIVKPELRYSFSCVLIDFTGQIVTSVYGDMGRKLIGISENELESMDTEKLKNTLDFSVLHKDLKVSGFYKTRVYNGESKTAFVLSTLDEVNYAQEVDKLLERMQITYDSVETFLSLKGPDSERDVKRAKT